MQGSKTRKGKTKKNKTNKFWALPLKTANNLRGREVKTGIAEGEAESRK